LATADLDGTGIDELVIGVLLAATVSGTSSPADGLVNVWSFVGGTTSRLHLYQDTPGIPDASAEGGDLFGAALTADDVGGDGVADLVVAAPGEDVSTAADAGMVHAIYFDLLLGTLVFRDGFEGSAMTR